MPDLDEETFKAVLAKRPAGMSPDDGIRQMISKGYTFGGRQLDPETLKPIQAQAATTEGKPKDAVDRGIDAVTGAVSGAYNALDKGVPEAIRTVGTGAQSAMRKVADVAGNMGGVVAETMGKEGLPDVASAAIAAPFEHAGGLAKSAIDTSASFVPTTPEDVRNILLMEGAGTVAGAAVRGVGEAYRASPAIQKAIAPSADAITGAADAVAQRAITAAKSIGINLTHAQLTQSPTWMAVENFIRHLPVASDMMREMVDKPQAEAMMTARKAILDSVGPAPAKEQVGREALDELGQRMSGLDAGRGKLYEAARSEVAPGKNVPALPERRGAGILASAEAQKKAMKAEEDRLYSWYREALPNGVEAEMSANNLDAAAQSVMKEGGLRSDAYNRANEIRRSTPDAKPDPALDNIREVIKKNPAFKDKLPPDIQAKLEPAAQKTRTLQDVNNLISDLYDKGEMAKRRGDMNEARRFQTMRSAAKADREAYLDMLPDGEAKRRLQIANAFHGNTQGIYDNDVIKDLWEKNPREVLDGVVRGGNEQATAALTRALGKDGKDIVKRELFDTVFGDGQVIPNKTDVMKRMSEYGASIRSLFTPAEQAQWRSFAAKGETPAFLQGEYERAVRGWLKQGVAPEKMADMVMSGDPLVAKAVKKYTSPEMWQKFSATLAEDLLTKGAIVDESLGNASVKKNLDRYSDEYLRHFFPQSTIDGMRRIGDASQLLPGFGDLAMKPLSPQAVGHIRTNGMSLTLPARALQFFIPGPALARMYMSAEGRQLMTTMMRIGENDSRIPKLLLRASEMGVLHTSSANQEAP